MTAFLSWVRPESVSIDPTLADGLQAQVADPLWLLSRQIGFGELSATDGGSPVSVSGTAIVSQLSRLRAGTGPGPQPHQAPGQQRPGAASPGMVMLPPPPGAPLEAIIEAEPEPTPYPPAASAITTAAAVPRPIPSAQAGMHYVRLLRAAGISDSAYIAALAATFPVPGAATAASWPAAAASDPLIRLYAGRVPDGQTLYGNLTQPRLDFSALPAGHPAPAAGFASVSAIAQSWLSWYEQTCSIPADLGVSAAQTWQPLTMEYAADLAAPGPAAETILRAGEHTAGPLDWYDFDLLASSAAPTADAAVSLGASSLDPAGGADQTVTWTALPVAATYPGAPNPRWWTFEDGAVNFGDINAASEGSVTAVVVEYALRYGNDHFIIPFPLRIGSLARLSRLVVTTTFGERILIRPAAELEPDGPFRLFELSGPDVVATQPRDPLIVMLPTVPEALAGPALESVTYARDEIAETVWAIEQTALGPLGLPVDRGTSPGSGTPPTGQQAAAGATTLWNYLLHTRTAPNWYAFVMPDPQSDNPTRMRFASITDPQTSHSQPLPWGSILAPQITDSSGLPQEEVTRAGLVISRTWRYARWTDGSTYAWVARNVGPGSGETDSGLMFDLAVTSQANAVQDRR